MLRTGVSRARRESISDCFCLLREGRRPVDDMEDFLNAVFGVWEDKPKVSCFCVYRGGYFDSGLASSTYDFPSSVL